MTTGRHTQQRSVPEEFERYLAWLISSPRERWSDTQLKQLMFNLYLALSDDERRVRQPEGRDVYLGEYYGSREPIQISAEEFNACIDVYGDFYKRTYGIDVREVQSPTFDEYLEVRVDGSQRLCDGIWGARLLKALHAMYDDYAEAWHLPAEMFDGSLFRHQKAMLDEVRAALEGGFVAKEPPMMFLAARFSEANNRIQPMGVDFDEEAILGRSHYACGGDEWQRQLRRLYLLACRWGSIHALLYVAWLLDTGCRPELFARDMRLAQRFLAQARAAGGALEAPLFPELSFMEDSEYDTYTITDELVSYEENYGRPAGEHPRPEPGWHQWHDFLSELDDLQEAWLWPEPERPDFEAWCAAKGMVVCKEAPEEG